MKKTFIAYIAFIVALVPAFSQDLIPFRQGAKWGYCDQNKKMVIPANYDRTEPFFENMARILSGTRWGYINRSGKAIVPPAYDLAWPWCEGLGLVVSQGKYGFIDQNGAFAIAPQYEDALPFSQDLAAVKSGGVWGYIDKTDKTIIAFDYSDAQPFREDLALVKPAVEESGKSFINRAGINVWTFAPEDIISDFHDDVFLYCGSAGDGLFAYQDRNGIYVNEKRFATAKQFGNGLAPVKFEDGWGFIKKDGRDAFPGRFEDALTPSEGLAAVRRDGKWGFIDLNGKIVVPCKYFWVEPFAGGLALVSPSGWTTKEGYIDKKGTEYFKD